MIQNEHIDGGRPFDWGRASEFYAKYRDIYPQAFYDKILELGLCAAGQRALDLGTGTGVLPRALARYGAHFIGADISKNQIETARRLSREAGLDIEYIVCPAERLEFPDASFDAVTAAQCFNYFDPAVVPQKIHRFLKPGGALLVAYMAWLPAESEIAARSEQLVLKHNPDWSAAGYTRPAPYEPGWVNGLFRCRYYGFDAELAFSRESWHGRMMACRGVGASSLTPERIAAFERDHRAFLAGCPERFLIPHHISMLVLTKACP